MISSGWLFAASVFLIGQNIYSLISLPYLLTAAAETVINVEFILSQRLRFAEYLKNISEFYL